MTDLELDPRIALYGVLGNGRSAHLLRYTAFNSPAHDADDVTAAGICGTKGKLTRRIEADERAIVAATNAPVCGICRARYDNGDHAIVIVNPTPRRRRRPATRGATPMTTTTDTANRAKSRDLLDPKKYAGTPVARLKAERTTINNRISGLNTQLKRAGDAAKKREINARLDDLLDRRDQLGDLIGAARSSSDGSTTNGNAKLAGATRAAGKELATPKAKTSRAPAKTTAASTRQGSTRRGRGKTK